LISVGFLFQTPLGFPRPSGWNLGVLLLSSDVNKARPLKAKAKASILQGQGQGHKVWPQGQGQGQRLTSLLLRGNKKRKGKRKKMHGEEGKGRKADRRGERKEGKKELGNGG